MELNWITEPGIGAVEGPAGQPLLTTVADVNRVIEACWSHHVGAIILYAANLTPHFFDLSSGEAGTILQKLQDYQLRLAVVCLPGEVTLSRWFSDLLAEEQRGRAFGVFPSRADALAWLAQ
ncbi:MAG: DUF4180 domain-containing protein [Chloroflexales bacterium]|nr:DUF4180 domain-containing protein [Chloroflexales bacterium]